MKNHTLKRFFGYLRSQRLRLTFVLLFASISTIFTVMAPFVIGRVTTTLFDSIRDGIFYWETILWLLAALIGLYFISQFFPFCRAFIWQRLQQISCIRLEAIFLIKCID